MIFRVLLLFIALLVGGATTANAASTKTASITVGSITPAAQSGYVTTDILLSSVAQPISAVTIRLVATNLRYVDSEVLGGVFPLSVSPVKSDGNSVVFSSARTDSGFMGTAGQILKVEWQPVFTGPATVSVDRQVSEALSFKDAANILGSTTPASGNVTYIPNSSYKKSGVTNGPKTDLNTMLGEDSMPLLAMNKGFLGMSKPFVAGLFALLLLAILLLVVGIRAIRHHALVATDSPVVEPYIPSLRLARITVVAGVLVVGIIGTGLFRSMHQAHADFLNPSNDHILPPTNVGMGSQWTGGKSISTIHWTPAKGAAGYAIYMNDIKIASNVLGTSYVINPATFNGNATYAMTSTDMAGAESIPSNISNANVSFDPANLPSWVSNAAPITPLDPIASGQWNLGVARIFLAWRADGSAQYFRVYRDGQMVADYLSDLTYVDSDVVAGASHTYQIVAVNSFYPTLPASPLSAPVTIVAPVAQPTFSGTPVTVTKVVTNDDSATVFFNTVPGATDYRVYNLANPLAVKYAGYRVFNTDPTRYYGGKVLEPAPYSIEMNGLNPSGADLVVEAVDKFGPFQKADGFAGPGSSFGTSVNGQSEPSNVPNVIARSQAFHITLHPFQLAGSQRFFDNFRNEAPLLDVPNDPVLAAAINPNELRTQKNDKWTITGNDTDTSMTRNFFMGGHFMDTMYDGPAYDKFPFSHNNNASNIIQPNQTADISGGKVLHVTMEVDGKYDGRRWTDIMVGQAGDTLLMPRPMKLDGRFPTVSGNLFAWDIEERADFMEFIHPNPSDPTHTVQTDLIQSADWNDLNTVTRNGYDARDGINGSTQDLDKRHTFDLFLSQNHYKIVETAPDGTQIVREKDFPVGYSLPFTNVQVYFTHELYHTGNDINELKTYSNGIGSGILGPSAQYWYNYRPFSDERHWDNMGFSVLNTFADAVVTPLPSAPPNYGGTSTPVPTPTPTVQPTATPTASIPPISYDLNGSGVKDLADLVLAIRAFNGLPNHASLLIWPPLGNPGIGGLVNVIRWFNS